MGDFRKPGRGRRVNIPKYTRFNHWVLQEEYRPGSGGYVVCLCDCSTEQEVLVAALRSGLSKGCEGCMSTRCPGKPALKHGITGKGADTEWKYLYWQWTGVKSRYPHTLPEDCLKDFQAYKELALATGYKHGTRMVRPNKFKPLSLDNMTWVKRKIREVKCT